MGGGALRPNIFAPSCPPRSAGVWLTTDWARLSRRPAAEKLPSSAAAMKLRSWSNETPSSIYLSSRYIISRDIGYQAGPLDTSLLGPTASQRHTPDTQSPERRRWRRA